MTDTETNVHKNRGHEERVHCCCRTSQTPVRLLAKAQREGWLVKGGGVCR